MGVGLSKVTVQTIECEKVVMNSQVNNVFEMPFI